MTQATSRLSDPSWQQAVQAIQLRNGALELRPRDKVAGAADRYKTRLLTFGREGLVVQRPSGRDVRDWLSSGTAVVVHANGGEQRWQLQSAVIGYEIVELNAGTPIDAVRLSYPTAVSSNQRRDHYRARTVADLPAAMMIPVATDGQSSEPIPTAFPARMLNASGGGLGVLAPAEVAHEVPFVELYRLRLSLPPTETPVEMRARVMHMEPTASGATYIGLRFVFDDDVEQRAGNAMMSQFCAWLQRQQLQRRRGRR